MSAEDTSFGTDLASQRSKLPHFGMRGIAARLLLSFAVIALMTIMAGAAGLWSLSSVGESLGEITENRLPTAVTSLALSRHTERIVALAPRLLSATQTEDRELARQQLAPEVNNVLALLERLRGQQVDSADLEAVSRLVDALRQHLDHLTQLLAQRDAIETQKVLGRNAILAFREDMGRLLDPWSQVLAKQLALVEQNSPIPQNLAELAVQLRALTRVQELATVLADRAVSVDSADSELTIGVQGFQANRAATSVLVEAKRVHDGLAHGLAEKLEQIGWALEGGGSVFAQARLAWLLRAKAEDLLAQTAAVSADLSTAIDRIVANTEQQAAQSKIEALETRKTALMTVVAAVTLSVLAVIGIGVGYVHGHLLTRLKSVTDTLFRLARNDLRADVPHAMDHDEIGELARGLATMQTGLMEKAQLDAEIREINRNLDQQVQARTAELQAANEAQAHVLAVLSHEIRSPLTGIIGVAEMLGDPAKAQRAQDHLGALREGAKALLSVVNSVLEHARLQAGAVTTEQIDYAPASVVNGVAALLRPQAEAKGLTVETQISASVPERLMGDEGRLRQVLVNLVTNAVKFTTEGGVVLHVSIDEANQLCINVDDTGIGVAEKARAGLFQAYNQTDISVNRRFGGTGLGLAISRGLVEAMGGRIGHQPLQPHGSRFWIVLPITGVYTQAPAAEPEQGEPALPLTVLVVDDNPVNSMVMCAQVEQLGHTAIAAHSGQEALAALAVHPCDAALLDLHLTDMDGQQLAQDILARLPPGRRMTLIAASGETQPSALARARLAGIQSFLAKPFTLQALRAALAEKPQKLGAPALQGLESLVRAYGRDWAAGFVETLREQALEQADRLASLDAELDHPRGVPGEAYRQVAHLLRPTAAILADSVLLAGCDALSAACRGQDLPAIRDGSATVQRLLRRIATELRVPEAGSVGELASMA